MMEVDLRPHVGHMGTALGVAEVEFDQWIVFARDDGRDWVQIGYLGKQPGAHLQSIVALPESQWKAIQDALAAKVNAVPAIAKLSKIQAEAAKADHADMEDDE